MIFRTASLLPVLFASRTATAYFAQANNAHIELVATGALVDAAVEAVDDRPSPQQHRGNDGLWDALEGALERHAPLGFAAPTIMALFEEWAARFGREYATFEEKSRRLVVWLENHALIATHNARKSSFALGHNEYSDLTHREFRQRMKLGEFSPGLVRSEGHEFKFRDFHEEGDGGRAEQSRLRAARRLPAKDDAAAAGGGKDWHAGGFMGPVRNQGLCGACWAFSAAGAIESAMAIDKFQDMSPSARSELVGKGTAGPGGGVGAGLTSDLGLVVPLSEQNMIDCDTAHEKGCDGGLMMDAFEEEEVKKGICSEVDYPYLATQGTCSSDLCTPVAGSIVKDRVDVVPRKNNALVEALDAMPVTAAVVATDPALQFYRSGIYAVEGCGRVTKELDDEECEMVYDGQDVCFPDVNHGVLVVGYGRDDAATGDVQTYFKVKNSWGGAWGEGGYFRLARYETDKTDPLDNWGECAILSLLSYPVVG